MRDGVCRDGAAQMGSSKWRRMREERCRAKSVFHFDVQGSVATSTHAGIPWLRLLRSRLGERVHFWSFDAWDVAPGRSVIAEVYPSLWRQAYPTEGRTGALPVAYAVAAWLRDADADGRLSQALKLSLTDWEQAMAGVEGWILGLW